MASDGFPPRTDAKGRQVRPNRGEPQSLHRACTEVSWEGLMLATMARPCLLPRLACAGNLVRSPRSPREHDLPGCGSCSQRLNLKPSNAPAPPKAAVLTASAVKSLGSPGAP